MMTLKISLEMDEIYFVTNCSQIIRLNINKTYIMNLLTNLIRELLGMKSER